MVRFSKVDWSVQELLYHLKREHCDIWAHIFWHWNFCLIVWTHPGLWSLYSVARENAYLNHEGKKVRTRIKSPFRSYFCVRITLSTRIRSQNFAAVAQDAMIRNSWIHLNMIEVDDGLNNGGTKRISRVWRDVRKTMLGLWNTLGYTAIFKIVN